MFCFIAGIPPDVPDWEERMGIFIEEVSGYEGLMEIREHPNNPNLVLLCFETKEAATTAQWMMELNGSKPRRRADRERDTENPGDHHDQPGDGEGGSG